MPIVAFEALLAVDRPLSPGDGAVFVRDLLERRPPAGEPLVPLPYIKKLWKAASGAIVSSAPVLALKGDVKARKDSAWPVSIQQVGTEERSGFVLSIGLVPPFGGPAEGWAWLRDWIAAIVADGSLTYAAINGSSNADRQVRGEGVPSLALLDEPVPAAVAPWFFLGQDRVARAGKQAATTLRELAAARTPAGLVFAPTAEPATPIPKAFLARYATVTARAPAVFQGKLPAPARSARRGS